MKKIRLILLIFSILGPSFESLAMLSRGLARSPQLLGPLMRRSGMRCREMGNLRSQLGRLAYSNTSRIGGLTVRDAMLRRYFSNALMQLPKPVKTALMKLPAKPVAQQAVKTAQESFSRWRFGAKVLGVGLAAGLGIGVAGRPFLESCLIRTGDEEKERAQRIEEQRIMFISEFQIPGIESNADNLFLSLVDRETLDDIAKLFYKYPDFMKFLVIENAQLLMKSQQRRLLLDMLAESRKVGKELAPSITDDNIKLLIESFEGRSLIRKIAKYNLDVSNKLASIVVKKLDEDVELGGDFVRLTGDLIFELVRTNAGSGEVARSLLDNALKAQILPEFGKTKAYYRNLLKRIAESIPDQLIGPVIALKSKLIQSKYFDELLENLMKEKRIVTKLVAHVTSEDNFSKLATPWYRRESDEPKFLKKLVKHLKGDKVSGLVDHGLNNFGQFAQSENGVAFIEILYNGNPYAQSQIIRHINKNLSTILEQDGGKRLLKRLGYSIPE